MSFHATGFDQRKKDSKSSKNSDTSVNPASNILGKTLSSGSYLQKIGNFTPNVNGINTGFDFAKIGIQPKLKVSQPDDPYEQEADRVADHVMRMPTDMAQRKCLSCQMKGKKYKDLGIRRKHADSSYLETDDRTSDEINNVSSTVGWPLDSSTMEFMESRFGHDFKNVRVHDDNAATRSASSVNALAYTLGNDVVFGEGQYRPNTFDGRKLIAHELSHVIHQGSTPTVRRGVVQRYVGDPEGSIGMMNENLRLIREALSLTPEGLHVLSALVPRIVVELSHRDHELTPQELHDMTEIPQIMAAIQSMHLSQILLDKEPLEAMNRALEDCSRSGGAEPPTPEGVEQHRTENRWGVFNMWGLGRQQRGVLASRGFRVEGTEGNSLIIEVSAEITQNEVTTLVSMVRDFAVAHSGIITVNLFMGAGVGFSEKLNEVEIAIRAYLGGGIHITIGNVQLGAEFRRTPSDYEGFLTVGVALPESTPNNARSDRSGYDARREDECMRRTHFTYNLQNRLFDLIRSELDLRRDGVIPVPPRFLPHMSNPYHLFNWLVPTHGRLVPRYRRRSTIPRLR